MGVKFDKENIVVFFDTKLDSGLTLDSKGKELLINQVNEMCKIMINHTDANAYKFIVESVMNIYDSMHVVIYSENLNASELVGEKYLDNTYYELEEDMFKDIIYYQEVHNLLDLLNKEIPNYAQKYAIKIPVSDDNSSASLIYSSVITSRDIEKTAKKLIAGDLSVDSISVKFLNTILSGNEAGISLPLVLSRTPEGIEVLAEQDHKLAKSIDKNTLNAIRQYDTNKRESVASLLISSEKGRNILLKSNLATLINSDTMNIKLTEGDYSGKSVTEALSQLSDKTIASIRHVF